MSAPAAPRAAFRAQSAGFRLHERACRSGLSCWLALPDRPRPGARPLIAVHGIGRAARLKAETFAARAAAQGRAVIAPLYDEAFWNGYQRAVAPRRADLALLELLKDLRAEGVVDAAGFDLFGYSGGAQFAHRFALLYPHLVGRLSLGAAGWWTFPDAAPYPYGLGGDGWGARMAAGLPRFLGLDIVVTIGAQDCEPDDATRRGEAIDAQQGVDRLTRARAWVAALREAAAARALAPPRIRLAVLPDAGHDFADCAAAGDGLLVTLTLGDAS
ncbi:hypothetical protein [Rubrimonas cliftonensis]|uniref:Alpha/beta hydrolase n=1 Tax=Rubrimonas cliftonensis TaxID=89524 RepID=A0A1H4FR19_9RHOB|nr:hypothetical protein [Rubrimonas cliftonensis]SEA98962.1 hypothetical protein SAMN05444370_1264 [Rubrimonas cliftonensis]